MVLSKAKQFGNVSIERNGNYEEISVDYTEKVDRMLFTFKSKITLIVYPSFNF